MGLKCQFGPNWKNIGDRIDISVPKKLAFAPPATPFSPKMCEISGNRIANSVLKIKIAGSNWLFDRCCFCKKKKYVGLVKTKFLIMVYKENSVLYWFECGHVKTDIQLSPSISPDIPLSWTPDIINTCRIFGYHRWKKATCVICYGKIILRKNYSIKCLMFGRGD